MNIINLCECTEDEYREILEDKDIGTFPRALTVMGTEYEVSFKPGTFEKFANGDSKACGLFCPTLRKIYLAYLDVFYYEKQGYTAEEMRDMLNITLRHEIIHAFFHESGLSNETDFAEDEILVDWIALQLPKIVNCMSKEELL